MESLEGKVAVVTGGARGIGRASAIMLADKGVRVVIGDISEEGANDTVATIEQAGGECIAVTTDVSQEPQMAALMQTAVERFSRLDVLANVAADVRLELHRRDDDIVDLDLDVWEHTMAVNLRGTMLGCKHAIPHMLASAGGAIVNFSSTGAIMGSRTRPSYSVSKAAIAHLTKCVAVQYGKRGILCNAIAPGFTLTEAMLENTPPELRKRWENDRNVVPKFGQPEDMAAAVVFLATGGRGRYITGQTLVVDGGATIKASE